MSISYEFTSWHHIQIHASKKILNLNINVESRAQFDETLF